ncbi:unnamed protein product [Rotaria sp. Silwood2]|nr:unnamed protein product [Rotaria sp. Silwood2]
MANFTTTQAYESSSESDNEMKVDQSHIQRKPIVRRSVRWVEEKVYWDAKDAQNAIKHEKRWSKYYTNKSRDGIIVYYRCNQVPFRGKQCDAAIHLYYPNDSNEKYGASTISLGNLENSCAENSTVPQSEDETFVLSYHVQYEDDIDDNEDAMDGENKFRFFITTKRLLKIASISIRIHADVTYKLNWQVFPELIIGATVFDRKLDTFRLAVPSNEQQQDFEFNFKSIPNGVDQIVQSKFMPEVLIADGSDAIRNAFMTTFNNDKIVMCWAPMRRHVDKKLKLLLLSLNDLDHLYYLTRKIKYLYQDNFGVG